MGTDSLGDWLSGWLRVNLYADNDAKGVSVAGRLRRLMVARKVAVRVFTLGSNYKDAADSRLTTPSIPTSTSMPPASWLPTSPVRGCPRGRLRDSPSRPSACPK